MSNELDPLLSKGVELEPVNGITYRIKRLGMDEVFDMADVISELFASGSEALQQKLLSLEIKDSNALGAVIMLGLPRIRNKVIALMASFLDVPTEDLRDPEKFSMDGIPKFLNALWKHPDFTGFFSQVGSMVSMIVQTAGLQQQEGSSATSVTASASA